MFNCSGELVLKSKCLIRIISTGGMCDPMIYWHSCPTLKGKSVSEPNVKLVKRSIILSASKTRGFLTFIVPGMKVRIHWRGVAGIGHAVYPNTGSKAENVICFVLTPQTQPRESSNSPLRATHYILNVHPAFDVQFPVLEERKQS